MLAFGGIVLGILAIAASIGGMIYAASLKPGRVDEGSRFGPDKNRSKPGDPSPWVGGYPRFRPVELARSIRLTNLNQFTSGENSKPEVEAVLDFGSGPIDGGGFSMWLDKTPIFEEVTPESSVSERTMVRGQVGRKEWFFSKDEVQASSATIYLDGVAYGVHEDEKPDVTTWETKDVTLSVAKGSYRLFLKDPASLNFKNGRRFVDGWILDTSLDEDSITKFEVRARQIRKLGSLELPSGEWFYVALRPENYTIETDDKGQRVLYLSGRAPISSPVSGLGYQYDSLQVTAKQFVNVSGDPPNRFKIVTDPNTHRSRAVFSSEVPTGAVTATFTALPFGFEVETHIRTGKIDQEPLPFDEGVKNTRTLSLSMTQGLRRTYTTSREVTDLDVSIASGSGGFFGMGSAVRGTTVPVRIRVRTNSAADAPAPSSSRNPEDGWVELEYNGVRSLPLHGKIQGGIARWQFRVSDGLGLNKLPSDQYVVEVTRLGADTPGDGAREMFFETVTEIEEQQFSFPGRALGLVRWKEKDGLTQLSEIEVQLRGRICRIYKGMKGVSYAEQFGRFLGAKNVNLPPGVTSVGAFVDPTNFVYDPALQEPDFDHKWTRNHVWLACEAILDDLAGGGVVGMDANIHINWESALGAANFCDRQVTFGGITDTAAECDYVHSKRMSLYAMVTRILAGSECTAIDSRGQWFFPFDVDDENPTPTNDPATGQPFTISDFDIIDEEIEEGDRKRVDGLQVDQKKIEQVATDFIVTFPDEEFGFSQDADPVYVPTLEDTPGKRVTRNVTFYGVRRRWQVERVTRKQAANELVNQRVVTIRCNNLYPYLLDPGDIPVLSSPSAKLDGKKVMVLEREMGSNQRLELKVALLQAARDYHPGFQGPNSGVLPGQRPLPTFTVRRWTEATVVPKSFILKVEEV